MSTILPYCAEYARTSKIWCDVTMILPDTVQIGIMQQVNILTFYYIYSIKRVTSLFCVFSLKDMIDDCIKVVEWYPMDYFFKIRQPVLEEYIEGFANLRYADQMRIREKIGKNSYQYQFNSELFDLFVLKITVSH